MACVNGVVSAITQPSARDVRNWKAKDIDLQGQRGMVADACIQVRLLVFLHDLSMYAQSIQQCYEV
jgi:hypothetical protein